MSAAFDRARQTLEAIVTVERGDAKIDPDNGSRSWLHDAPTERAVVLLHGITNNPRQYAVLGPQLFADGHNVIAPRFPYHGYRDRMTEDIAAMRFVDWATTAIDAVTLARATAARVTVLGISVSGAIAAWLAGYLPIDHGIAVAPFVGVRLLSSAANEGLNTALHAAPNVFLYWDPIHKAAQIPAHAYPRVSTHALARTLRFGETFDAFRSDAHGKRVSLVLNAHEPIVNNAVAAERAAVLRLLGVDVRTIERADFPHRHDVIEPTLPGGPDAVVCAALRDLCALRSDA